MCVNETILFFSIEAIYACPCEGRVTKTDVVCCSRNERMIYFQENALTELTDPTQWTFTCPTSFGPIFLPFVEYVRWVPIPSLVVVKGSSKLTLFACEHGNTVGIAIMPCSTTETNPCWSNSFFKRVREKKCVTVESVTMKFQRIAFHQNEHSCEITSDECMLASAERKRSMLPIL